MSNAVVDPAISKTGVSGTAGPRHNPSAVPEPPLQRWMQEIRRFLPVKPQFLLWGNIYDVFPFFPRSGSPEAERKAATGPAVTMRLRDYLKAAMKKITEVDLVVEYLPMVGFWLLEGDPAIFKKITGQTITNDKPLSMTLKTASEVIEKLVRAPGERSVIIISNTSRLKLVEPENVMNEFYYRMFALSQEAVPKLIVAGTGANPGGEQPAGSPAHVGTPLFDPIFWLVDREQDFPDWYCLNNARIRSLNVPRPDYETRRVVIDALARALPGFGEAAPEARQTVLAQFADQTAGMTAGELIAITQLARNEKIGFHEVGEAIKRYRVGVIENPWAKLDLDKLANAHGILQNRVKGQHEAVDQAVSIIQRAVFNLSGSQYSRFSLRPKGVLFFAGPTGVGKTELAKSVTELLFGSESNYIRFDMSEFGHEHADQRLVGAPPGYVGYDAGGQLTNAVKANPFSVILFDELEKAHPKILDMFLQILDDGRLTSGRGETVYFTESLIVFTSNLGIYETLPDGSRRQRVDPTMDYATVKSEVLSAIREFFTFQLNRPEILNRIGENLVVFDFIRPVIARQILERMLGNILAKARETTGLELGVPPATVEKLLEFCTKDLSMGGRGIGNVLEKVFLNPLSGALFSLHLQEGSSFQAVFRPDGKLVLEKTARP